MVQAQVLRALMSSNVWKTYGETLQEEDFDSVHGPVFAAIAAFHRKYPTLRRMTLATLQAEMPEDRKLAKRIGKADIPDTPDLVLDGVRQFAMNAHFVRVLQAHTQEYQNGTVNVDAMQAALAEIARQFAAANTSISMNQTPYSRLYDPASTEHALPMPVRELTRILDGGPAAGELMTVLAPPDGGKSMFLINLTRHAWESGKVVVHVTLETTPHQFTQRLYCSLAKRRIITLQNNPWAFNQLRRQMSRKGGDVELIDGSSIPLSVADMERACEEALRKNDGRLDALIIDYGDLLKSPKKFSSARDEQQLVWQELCRLSKQLKIPVITASQLNRSGAQAKTADMTHVAESWAKATHSQIVVSIERDDIQKSRGEATLRILKTKKSGGYGIVPCVFDTKTCRVETGAGLPGLLGRRS